MILFGYHIFEKTRKTIRCTESGAEVERKLPDGFITQQWVTIGDVDRLDELCPGHSHKSKNTAAIAFAREHGFTYAEGEGGLKWTEADEVGAVTLHDTSAAEPARAS